MTDHPIQDAITKRLEDDTPTEVKNDLVLYLGDLCRNETAWLENAEERLVEAHA